MTRGTVGCKNPMSIVSHTVLTVGSRLPEYDSCSIQGLGLVLLNANSRNNQVTGVEAQRTCFRAKKSMTSDQLALPRIGIRNSLPRIFFSITCVNK